MASNGSDVVTVIGFTSLVYFLSVLMRGRFDDWIYNFRDFLDRISSFVNFVGY